MAALFKALHGRRTCLLHGRLPCVLCSSLGKVNRLLDEPGQPGRGPVLHSGVYTVYTQCVLMQYCVTNSMWHRLIIHTDDLEGLVGVGAGKQCHCRSMRQASLSSGQC